MILPIFQNTGRIYGTVHVKFSCFYVEFSLHVIEFQKTPLKRYFRRKTLHSHDYWMHSRSQGMNWYNIL